jgi:hypothetical protein
VYTSAQTEKSGLCEVQQLRNKLCTRNQGGQEMNTTRIKPYNKVTPDEDSPRFSLSVARAISDALAQREMRPRTSADF